MFHVKHPLQSTTFGRDAQEAKGFTLDRWKLRRVAKYWLTVVTGRLVAENWRALRVQALRLAD